jgi:hypothetical protein
MTIEMTLYIDLKRFLRSHEWEVIGGQPPSGTDHLPVLEMKTHVGAVKGSKESYKPDIVAYKANQLLIVEIKPSYSASDNSKLLSILEEPTRLETLWAEIETRKIRSKTDGPLAVIREQIEIQLALCHLGERPGTGTVWTYCMDKTGKFQVFNPD